MRINTKYDIGQTVYLITDREQSPRIITGIKITPGTVVYFISHGTNESIHYDFEFTTTKNIVTTLK